MLLKALYISTTVSNLDEINSLDKIIMHFKTWSDLLILVKFEQSLLNYTKNNIKNNSTLQSMFESIFFWQSNLVDQ